MSDRGPLQSSFDAIADELGLELEHAPFEIGDHTDLGLLLIVAARSVAELETAPIGSRPDEDAAIRAVVQGYESLSPDEHPSHIGEFAIDPFVLVHADAVGVVHHDRMDDEDVRDHMSRYPLKSPRDVTLSNVQIVHLGASRAAVTYTVDESFSDGTSMHANAVAVVVKLAAGWRIAVVSDRADS